MTSKTLSLITATLLLTTNTFAEETLQDITVISATKSTQNIKNVTSNVSVITASDIEERGYTTVAEALNSIAGVNFTQNGGLGQATSVYLRGMDSKRTLVLIDGIRVNDVTGLNGAAFEHIMVANIAQIEVIKGAQSGVWGADASAGVINIITKQNTKGEHGSMYAEGGSFKTKKYGVTLSKTTDTYHAKIAHNVTKTDGFSAQAPMLDKLDSYEDDGYTNTSTAFDFGYNINQTNKLDFSYTTIDTEGDYDTFGNPNGVATTTSKQTFSSINFNHIDSFNEVNLYAKNSKFDRDYTAPDFTGTVATTKYKGEVKEYGITSKIPYAGSDFVLLGAEYKRFEQQDSIDKAYDNKAFFVTNSNVLKNPMGGKLIFTQSLRHDSYNNFNNKNTGKLGIKSYCTLIDGLVTSVNYGTSYNVPTLYQLYSQYGSEALNPETTKSFDVTLGYKDFSLTYFDTKIDDMIDFDTTTFKYGNISGTSKISGLEASYQKEIHSNVLFSLNYTRLFKAQNQKGEDLKRRAKDDVKIALDYYGITDLHMGVDAQYIGDRVDTKFNPDFTTSDVQTGKYTIINLNASYKLSSTLKVYAKVHNLSDEKYQTVYGFSTSPRAFYAGMKATF